MFYHDTILADMAAIRETADLAETYIPKDLMPYPDYADLLFYV